MIREGEIMASIFLLILAVATAKLAKSPWPFVLAIGSGAAMVGVYEFALARSPISTGVGGEDFDN